MPRLSLRRTLRPALLAAAAGLACLPAGAADVHWSPQCSGGDWDSFCWSLNAGGAPMLLRPGSGDAAWLQRDGGRLSVSFGGGSAVPLPATLSRLTLDGRQSGSVELTLQQGHLQAGTAVLGASGRGAVFQQGGLFSVGGDLVLGQEAGSQGHYRLEAGSLTVGGQIKQSGGRGTLVLAGGSLSAQALALDRLELEASGPERRTEFASWNANTRSTVIGQQGGQVALVRQAGEHRVREDLLIRDGSQLRLDGGRMVVEGRLQGEGSNSELRLRGGELQVGGDITVGLFTMAPDSGQTARFTLAAGQTLQTQHSWLALSGNTEFIQNGGTHRVANDLRLSEGPTRPSTYRLNGGRLEVGHSVVSSGGPSTLVIDGGQLSFGHELRAHQLLVGEGTGRRGELVLPENAYVVLQQAVVGGAGQGQLQSSAGWTIVEGNLVVGRDTGGQGLLQVDKGLFSVSGAVTIGDQGRGELQLTNGFVSTPELTLARQMGSTGRLTLSGGRLEVQGILSGGLGASRIDFDGGTLTTDSVTASHISFASAAGRNGGHTLEAGQRLWTQRLDLGLAGEGTLTLAGGSVEVWGETRIGGLAGSAGTWMQRSGSATLQGDLVLGGEGGRAWLQIDDGTLAVQGRLRKGSGFSVLQFNGGQLLLGSGGAEVDQLQIGAAGVWRNQATVHQTLHNEGLVQADRLQVHGVLANVGQVTLAGGEIGGEGRWANVGQFTGHGRLAMAGGLENSGRLVFSAGSSDLASRLLVAGTGRLEVEAGAALRVGGPAQFDARAVLAIHEGGEASFEAGLQWSTGAVRQGGGLWHIGAGMAFFGTPAALNADGSLTLADSARTTLRLGAAGAHDALAVTDALTLGGSLVLTPWDGFQPQAGAVYDLLDWGSLNGRFSAVDLSALPLPAGLQWDTGALYTQGELRIGSVSAVPEPSHWAMFASGLAVLGFVARRRTARPTE